MSTNIGPSISSYSNINQNLISDSKKNQTSNKDQSSQDAQSKFNPDDFNSIMEESLKNMQEERISKSEGKKNFSLTGDESESDFFNKISSATPTREEPKNVLNKDDFLKLFMLQLQNQDPLNPEDTSEMSARLAQFNSLEQMMNMNTSLNKLIDMQTTNNNSDYVKFIGKEVSLNKNEINISDTTTSSNPVHIAFNLPSEVNSCILNIKDQSGKIVFNKELGKCSGEQDFSWDGTLKNGSKIQNGHYSYDIKATNSEGISITPELKTKVRITGLDLKDKNSPLISSIGKINLSDISAVSESSGDTTSKNITNILDPRELAKKNAQAIKTDKDTSSNDNNTPVSTSLDTNNNSNATTSEPINNGNNTNTPISKIPLAYSRQRL